MTFESCNFTNSFISTVSLNPVINSIAFDNITLNDCIYNNSNGIIDVAHNTKLSNITINNLYNNKTTPIVNIKTSGCTIENLTVNKVVNPISNIVKSTNTYSLYNLTVNDIDASCAFDTFEDMTISYLNFTKSNFTSGVIATLSKNIQISDSNINNVSGHFVVTGTNVGILDSNFTYNNNTGLNGGIFLVKAGADYFKVRNCQFKNNSADYGGAIYVEEDVQRTGYYDTLFKNNTAKILSKTIDPQGYYSNENNTGGAIYFNQTNGKTHIVTHDDYTWNNIKNDTYYFNNIHGVLSQLVSDVYVVLNPSNWTHVVDGVNYTSNGKANSWLNAGSLYNAFLIAGDDCVFHFVNASEVHDFTKSGMGFSADTFVPEGDDPNVVSDNLYFEGNNTTISHLGFHVLKNRTMYVYNITFSDFLGTSVIVDGEGSIFENVTFKNNGGIGAQYAAGMQINANNTKLINVTFIDNHADNAEGTFGGGLYINASNVDVINSTFKGNKADMGSHIYIEKGNEFINIMGNTFAGVKSVNTGVSLNSGTKITIVNNTFENNSKIIALNVVGNYLYLDIINNTFKNNTLAVYASALNINVNALQGMDINIKGNDFIGNNATDYGGALVIDSTTTPQNLKITSNTFIGNNATQGGALYIKGSDISLSNFTFIGNNATQGGALYIKGSDISLSDFTFIGNNATRDGGAIYNNNTLSLNSNAFNGNGAVNGGAIYNNGVLVDKESKYNGNNATRDGGAIYSKSDLDYTATSSTSRDFVGNRAVNGGALYINGTNNNIRGAYFYDNYADYGSCIYVENNTDLNVYGTSIVNNHVANGSQATGGHGDIYLGNVVNFAIPDDGLFLEPQTTGSSTYDQYIYNSTGMVRSDVLYVSESGTGLGLMSSEPTTLDKALEAINDNGRIIFVESYMLNSPIINRNVTLAGYNSTISMKRNNTTAGENKYLFILSIFEDYFKILVMLLFCRYSLSLILCLIL